MSPGEEITGGMRSARTRVRGVPEAGLTVRTTERKSPRGAGVEGLRGGPREEQGKVSLKQDPERGRDSGSEERGPQEGPGQRV